MVKKIITYGNIGTDNFTDIRVLFLRRCRY